MYNSKYHDMVEINDFAYYRKKQYERHHVPKEEIEKPMKTDNRLEYTKISKSRRPKI